ncbi:MAG TPA: LPS export ABC transporter periplasmic protein LptC [Puia sp.]|nr:LPS export ABC transporter periplasmic protein LptC [Puia sp.]
MNIIRKRPGRNVQARLRWMLFPVLLIGLGMGGCENNMKDLPGSGKKKVIPETGRQIESYLSEGAKVKGKLSSPYMLRYMQADSPYVEFPRTLHVDFYNDSLVIESQVDALYGKYFQNQSKVFLRDQVVVKNILRGDTLHCKELWWDQSTSKFYTDKPVQIYTKDKILFGTGMEADQSFRWYTIKKLTGSVLTAEHSMPK